MAFSAKQLADACPPDLRILCCLSLERPRTRYKAIETLLDSLRRDDGYTGATYRLAALQPFNEIDIGHLKNFLEAPGNSTWQNKTLLSKIPALILSETKGSFARTVELVEEGEDTGWWSLYDRLIEKHPHIDTQPPETESIDLNAPL